jgi:twitching motility protein PilT
MIDLVNRSMRKHVVTIEDPIEFLHRDHKSIVNQREVGTDTVSFSRALRRVLRQDPDIILIGEIRDSEGAQIALSRLPRQDTSPSRRSTPSTPPRPSTA